MNIAVQVAGISAGPEPRVSLGVSTDTGVSFGCDVVIDWNAPAAQMETDIITRVTTALADFGVTVMPGDQRRILGDGATNLDSLPDVSISFTADGDAYYVARVATTLAASPAEAGTGALTYSKALAASTTSFSSTSLPVTLAAGDVLKVTCASISGYKAVTLQRSA